MKKEHNISRTAGKLLIIFFALMLALTLVSRFMATVTVPVAESAKAKKMSLSKKISGSGTISASSERYIVADGGRRIAEIYANIGNTVKAGDPLFSYSPDEISKEIKKKQEEIESLKTEIEKTKLENAKVSLSETTDKEQLAVLRARLDLSETETSLLDAISAWKKSLKENLDSAVKTAEAAREAEEKAEKAVTDAEKAYEKALESVKECETNLEKANAENTSGGGDSTEIIASRRIVEDYTTAYNKAKENFDKNLDKGEYLLGLISKYYFSAEDIPTSVKDELIKELYGDDYPAYVTELQRLKKEYSDCIINADMSAADAVQAEIDTLKVKENELFDDIVYYNTLIHSDPRNLTSKLKGMTVEEVEQYILKKLNCDKSSTPEKELNAAKETLERAEEDLALLEASTKESLENAVISAKKALAAARDDVNSSAAAISDAKTALQKATDEKNEAAEGSEKAEKNYNLGAAETAENPTEYGRTDSGISAARSAVDTARRILEDAESALALAGKTLEIEENNDEISDKISSMDMTAKENELDEKDKELQKLNEIYGNDCKVCSEYDGVILSSDLQKGAVTTGGELIKIAGSSFVLKGTLDKKSAEKLSVGDKANVVCGSERTNIDSEIVEIGTADADGNAPVTLSLPDDKEISAGYAEFSVMRNLGEFECCVPITALHSDGSDTYIYTLTVKEGILGTEFVATKMSVTVSAQNKDYCALSDAYGEGMDVITSATKPINDGDTVRRYD